MDRPPPRNFENALEIIENNITHIYADENLGLIIMGDLNADMLNTTDIKTKKYNTFFKQISVDQLVNEPTRVTDKTITLLDHVLGNRKGYYVRSGILDPGPSQHEMVYTSRKKLKSRGQKTKVYDWSYSKYSREDV